MTLWQRLRALLELAPRGIEIQQLLDAERGKEGPSQPLFPPRPWPPPYPGPDVLGPIEEQRRPLNYLNLHLPDGSTIAIIPLLRLPLATPGTWANNDPGAGSVSWTGCQVAHEGEIFEIDDGNTSDAYIYWDKSVSETAFQTSAAQPTIDPTEDLLICYNDGGTAKLAFLSDLVQAGYIVCQQLDALSANMGILTAGEIRLGAGTPGVDFTGIRIYKDGATYRVAGYSNDVLQAYMDSDGKLYAGGGEVVLDAGGVTIEYGLLEQNSVKWVESGAIAADMYRGPASLVIKTRHHADHSAAITDVILALKAEDLVTGKNAAIYLQPNDGSCAIKIDGGAGLVTSIDIDAPTKTYLSTGDLEISILGKALQFVDSFTKIFKGAGNDLTFEDVNAGVVTLDGLVKVAGDIMTGSLNMGEQSVFGTSETISDDGVYSFTPGKDLGIIIIYNRYVDHKAEYGLFVYRCRSSGALFTQAIIASADWETATGALTGTTGTNGKCTLSAHSDEKLYIENRMGASRYLGFQCFGM